MTLVFNPSLGLQNIQLGLNEIASAITISKVCGSVLTRPEATSLFDAFESKFNIHITGLQVWLQDIQFARSSNILGERMRRIHLPEIMQDVDKAKLSGIATFVVLCTQFAEEQSNIRRLLEVLLVGGLGEVVQVDPEQNAEGIPYSFKPHIDRFIMSCMDADRDSQRSNKAREWMARLTEYGSWGWRPKDFSPRKYEANLRLMAEMLGAPTLEEELIRLNISSQIEVSNRSMGTEWAREHNTLHISAAYIALTAAANGATVVVQCMKSDGCQYFPKEPPIVDRPSTFLVRLWVCQPPEHVCGLLRYANSTESKTETSTSDDGHSGNTEENIIIHGGLLEICIWIAKKVGYIPTVEGDPKEVLLQLWSAGAKIAQEFEWSMSSLSSPKSFLLWPKSSEEPTISTQGMELSKAFLIFDETSKRTLSRFLAIAVHKLYRLEDYSPLCDPDRSMEALKAMDFLRISMLIESLRTLVHCSDHRLDQYALSLETLTAKNGALRKTLSDVMSRGATATQLVLAASTVWVGEESTFRQSRTGRTQVGIIVGIVAPHCTVILDIIRDPLQFAGRGLGKGMISIWHGSVPMLPRDPHTRYCYSPKGVGDCQTLSADYKPKTERPEMKLSVITYEPSLDEPTSGVLCCYSGGHQVAELCPSVVFDNLLNELTTEEEWKTKATDSATEKKKEPHVLRISPTDLFELGQVVVEKDVLVIMDGLKDLSSRIWAAGYLSNICVHHGTVETLDTKIAWNRYNPFRSILIVPNDD